MTLTADPPVRQDAAPDRRRAPAVRTLLVVPAMVMLLVGMYAGLDMLGVWVPVHAGHVDDAHGIVLVMGFVGTLVAAERAVALAHPLGYLAPAALGTGGLMLLSTQTKAAGATLMVLGAIALVGVYVPLWRRQRDDAVLVQALGAVLAVGSLILWRGGVPVPSLLAWLAGFVILTIAGERLELARLAMQETAARQLVALAGALAIGAVSILLWPVPGAVAFGLVVLALSAWLARHDVARRTIRSTRLARYMAACILASQVWMAVAGGVWLVGGAVDHGAGYDAVVHAVFLGFTMSMIMAHAPVILPAVTRIALPFHPAMYAPVLLLQGSL
ncbi:MAG: hypothetical protein ACRDO2_10640, partial [Nocardioidaceae bacterium]